MKKIDQKPAVFICHASEDNDFVRALIKLLGSIGIKGPEHITCTSIEGLGIPNGTDWDKNLRARLSNKKTYFIVVHSSHLYKSPVSMNELGAAWIKKHKIFSFFVKGFDERNMNSVLTPAHQGTKVVEENAGAYLDQLKNDIESLFTIENKLKDSSWEKEKEKFLTTVNAIPEDKSLDADESFDISITLSVHTKRNFPWGEGNKDRMEYATWGDILKVIAPVLKTPHTETAIVEALQNEYSGIIERDISMIIDQLHSFGLAETHPVNDNEGISIVWMFSELGRKSYEMAQGYHLLPENKARDEKTLRYLFENFNTDYMDEYLRENLEYVDAIVVTAHTNWQYILGASNFRLYDTELENVIMPFYKLWTKVSDGTCYSPTANPNRYKLVDHGFGIVNKDEEKKLKFIRESWSELLELYRNMISYIKTAYPQIDLTATNVQFLKTYK